MSAGETTPSGEPIFTVSSLTEELKGMLGVTYGRVWVQGEISQLRRPASGHVYLTLKDRGAVLPCVLWRSTVARMRMEPEEGLEVLVQGGIDVYPPHGRYQLVIRSMQPVGAGALQLAFEQLRARLEREGLFDEGRKQQLPAMPSTVALVTSRTGAAVRDMVSVMRRRFPRIRLLLVSTRVQGPGSAAEIAAALERADTAGADLIIVGRGGGSLEDLWSFNEEVVARAIAACTTPVISAVGHETDTTISDLVADVRAATPSQAGELAVPILSEITDRLDQLARSLELRTRRRLDLAWQQVEALAERPALRDVRFHLGPRERSLQRLAERLRAQQPRHVLRRRRDRLEQLADRLAPAMLRPLPRMHERVTRQAERLLGVRAAHRERHERQLGLIAARLDLLSPLAVLGRGYSLTRRLDDGGTQLVRRTDDVQIDDALATRLGDGGTVMSRVTEIVKGTPS